MNKLIKYLKMIYVPMSVIFIGVVFTGAYFSDSETSTGNEFQAGTWAVTPAKATISEVFYNAVGTDTGKEWIEIHNTGGLALDMTGYVLHFDTLVTTYDYIFPTLSLAPDARVVLRVRTSGANTLTNLYWPDTGGTNMGNSYGSVSLFKSLPKDATTIVDFVEYGSTGHDSEMKALTAIPPLWTSGTFVPIYLTEGHSMELIGADNNLVTDWQDQAVPTPGA